MPSTSSSKTMSAWLIAVCGRAQGLLSIFTTTAGCCSCDSDRTGSPVSGYAGPRGTVVVGAGGGFVVVVAAIVFDAAFEQPTATSGQSRAARASAAAVERVERDTAGEP